MVNYENGKIYKIVCDDKMYIGSTCEEYLSQRLARHVKDLKSYYSPNRTCKKSRSSVYELFQIKSSKPEIFLIEEYPCKNKQQLLARERHHIESNDCVNKIKRSILTFEEVQHQLDNTKEATWKHKDLKRRLENMKKEISLMEAELDES
jgi:hypothetical protein